MIVVVFMPNSLLHSVNSSSKSVRGIMQIGIRSQFRALFARTILVVRAGCVIFRCF